MPTPRTCGITGRVIPANGELIAIRLDERTAKHMTTFAGLREPLEPGLYHASIECADELRRIVAEDSKRTTKPRTIDQVGYKELC